MQGNRTFDDLTIAYLLKRYEAKMMKVIESSGAGNEEATVNSVTNNRLLKSTPESETE